MKKNLKKVLLLVLCAALLVSVTVAGTVAYLTSTAKVENTFTVGQVKITMDEALVNEYGQPINNTTDKTVVDVANAPRVAGNTYKLIPGFTYTKDPVVHVVGNSENSWIFVKVVNNIADNVGEIGLDAQIQNNGWTPLVGANGVYYKEYTKQTEQKDLKVFETFTIPADNLQGTTWTAANNEVITVTAYAIQKTNGTADGFTPATAWEQVKNLA